MSKKDVPIAGAKQNKPSKLLLDIKNAHPRDEFIEFDEPTHVYTICGDSKYISVTTFIHSFFPHFNADEIIKKMQKSKNWGPENQYYGKTIEEIKQGWDQNGKEASEAGTIMHAHIERYYNDIPLPKQFKDTPEGKLFEKYAHDHAHYKPFRTEWTVYSKKYKLAGSIDMVYHDPDNPGKFIIADWKRAKEIKKENKWENGLGPLSNIQNCNYWHYTLQLNIYRMILEKYYDKEISSMFLVILHPSQTDYIKIPINRISHQIMGMLDDRKRNLK
jgi:ATP-dependent exoDNAse (exonuclease V) beta subunit